MQFRLGVAICVLGLCCAWPALSQDQQAAPGRVIAVAQKEKVAKSSSPRLPNNYGKLELTADQKEQIYTTQAKFNGQIDALEEQINALKEKRDEEIAAVLTAEQKLKLKTLQATAKKKKDDKASKDAEAKPKAE